MNKLIALPFLLVPNDLNALTTILYLLLALGSNYYLLIAFQGLSSWPLVIGIA